MRFENQYIRFDWAIKNSLRDKANFVILEGLISVLIGKDVKIIEILESEGNQDSKDDKFNKVDIKARNSEGHIILVEVQLTTQLHYLQRILYGTCKTITDHMRLGDTYANVSKVYSISLLYCDFGEGDDYVYKGETVFKGIHTGNPLIIRSKEDGVIRSYLPKEVFPEYYLVRVNSFDKIPDTPLEEWMDYLKNGNINDDTDIPGLKEAKSKLQVLSMSESEKQSYFYHLDSVMQQNDAYDTAIEEGREIGRAEGRAEGIEIGEAKGRTEGIEIGKAEGRAEEMRKAIRLMYAAKVPIEVITKSYGISQEEVKEIVK